MEKVEAKLRARPIGNWGGGERWRARRSSCDGNGAGGCDGGCAGAKKEAEEMKMACAGQCGRARGVIRRALAWLGRTGQGAGDTRRASAPRGTRALKPVDH